MHSWSLDKVRLQFKTFRNTFFFLTKRDNIGVK